MSAANVLRGIALIAAVAILAAIAYGKTRCENVGGVYVVGVFRFECIRR